MDGLDWKLAYFYADLSIAWNCGINSSLSESKPKVVAAFMRIEVH